MALPAVNYQVTPVLTRSGAYSGGNCVGPEQALGTAAQPVPLQAVLESISVEDADNQKQPLSFLFFSSDPKKAATPATVVDQSSFA